MKAQATMRWTIVLGVALGGFFDGILLHQILQWHHLFSGVSTRGDLRAQILWDGVFHLLMYVLAVVALWRLWLPLRDGNRSDGVRRLSTAQTFGATLIGFGLWHVLDAVLSHWLLGIHRVRQDSPDPLLWDLIWLAAFGVAPILAGYVLLRRRPPPRMGGDHRRNVAVASIITLCAAISSLLPPQDARFTVMVMRPGLAPDAALASITATGSRLVWADPALKVMVIDTPADFSRTSLYRHGALIVSGTVNASACLNWSGV